MNKISISFNDKIIDLDESKLAKAVDSFIAHLGTIAGNDFKVVVDGVEYGVDATKIAGAIAGLEGHLAAMVDEPGEPELGFPIVWNSMEVIDNASFSIGNFGTVKVSDYIPPIDEMANTIITVTDANETRIYKHEATNDTGVFYFIGYEWAAGNKTSSMEICIVPTTLEGDGNTVEAGLYVTNFGSTGYNADCVLDIAPEEHLDDDVAL